MPIFYDADGNEVEAVPTTELDATIEARKSEWEQANAPVHDELKQAKEALAKLENKDMNFRRLEQMSEKEKEQMSVEKIELMKRIESLEDGITNIKTETIESTKEKAIQKFTNGDTELADKVKEKLNRFQPPKTKEEMLQNVREAYMLVAGKEPSVVFNPGFAGTPSGGSSYQSQQSAPKADPSRVEALGRSMGLGNYFDEQK